MNLDEFRNQKFEVFYMFDRQWAIAAAGNEKDFDGCTIGWGTLGDIWGTVNKGKLIVTIYINPLRYTSEYLMKEDTFTVSFFDESHKKDLGIIGSKSGRDGDKFSLTGLTPRTYKNSVVFEEANLTFVCRKIYWHQFEQEHIAPDIMDNLYNKFGMPPHYEFIGEIVDVIDKRENTGENL